MCRTGVAGPGFLPICLIGGLVVQTRMRPVGVVEINPALETLPDLAAGFKSVQVNALVFQGAPEPLDHDVVHPAPFAIHRNADIGVLLEGGNEFVTGELAALIGVEDLRLTIKLQDLFQGGNPEIGILGIGQPAGQHFTGGPVHDRHQVEKAAPHRDVGHIGTPDLIGRVDSQPSQQIRINLVLRMRFRRVRFLVNGRQAHQPHQSTDPLATDSVVPLPGCNHIRMEAVFRCQFANVCSPLIASRAILALTSAEYRFRLVLLMSESPSSVSGCPPYYAVRILGTTYLKAIHASEDKAAAQQKAEQVIEKLEVHRLKEAAKKVRESIGETLMYNDFPRSHYSRIRTNNALERIMKEIRRRTKVVGAFPDGHSALILCAAQLRHIAGTKWGQQRYLNMELLKEQDFEQQMEADAI